MKRYLAQYVKGLGKMVNYNEIVSYFLDSFRKFHFEKKILDEGFYITNDAIIDFIDAENEKFKGKEPYLNSQQKEDIFKKIKSIYEVHMDEGYAILADYEHDQEWYINLKKDEKYEDNFTERYFNYLKGKGWASKVCDTIDADTDKIMSYIGNPEEVESCFAIRGLVVGDVQSGKTSNYTGLMAKALDSGYNAIFVLTGTVESLRRQTQIRIEEGIIGYDAYTGKDVGVTRGGVLPRCYTNRTKDFVGSLDQTTGLLIADTPLILIMKKNVSVLKKLYSSIKKINTHHENEKINGSLLIIDDEADNASINTNKEDEDPTKINDYITKILTLFERNTYIGYTATPFANVFISYNSEDEMLRNGLFPHDFIYALNSSSNYCGCEKYFTNDNKNVIYIDELENELMLPMKHKKDVEISDLYPSLYRAIDEFLLINTVRDFREPNKNTHRSMMINISRFTSVQILITNIIKDYVDNIKKITKLTSKLPAKNAEANETIQKLKTTYEKMEVANVDWGKVRNNLYESIKNIEIVSVNSCKSASKLNYDAKANEGYRVIAVGGLALSRGLTLEGLCVSYFYRNTCTYDVLMQMGRWFGYRGDYEDLCKIYITEKSKNFYKEIYVATKKLKDDIRVMSKENKKPEEYGIRVMNNSSELGITARNKMRSATVKHDRTSFYDNFFETQYLSRDLELNEKNKELTFELFSNINIDSRDLNVKNPYFRNIDKKLIINLVEKIDVSPACIEFDTKQLANFLKKCDENVFDVLVMSGESDNNFEYKPLNINIPLVQRTMDTRCGNSIIRISGSSAHLIGSSDARYGLTEVQKPLVANAKKAQDFMVKGRNPLLSIYFIEPKKPKVMNEVDSKNFDDLVDELSGYENKYLVAFCLMFPKKDNIIETVNTYFVHKDVNFYDKMHDEDDKFMFGEKDDE